MNSPGFDFDDLPDYTMSCLALVKWLTSLSGSFVACVKEIK